MRVKTTKVTEYAIGQGAALHTTIDNAFERVIYGDPRYGFMECRVERLSVYKGRLTITAVIDMNGSAEETEAFIKEVTDLGCKVERLP